VRVIVGVDLGGTNIVVGAVTEDGRGLYGLASRPTPVTDGPDGVIARISEMVGDTVTAAKAVGATAVLGVGVGAPGPLDTARGVVHVAPNLGWRNVPLRDRVAALTGLSAALENDANCAVFGEWWMGAAQGAKIVVGITIGTGVGGGIVIDGKLYHGASDAAGEIGHTTIDSTGRRCKCGNYGCLEAYASGPAIASRAVEGMESGEVSDIPRLVGGDLSKVTAQTVYEAAHAGDAFALEVVKDTARFLGTGVANLVNVLNPEVVVVCGGVTLAGDRLLEPLRAEVKRRAFKPAADACRIVLGTLTGTAGVYGAAAAFKQRSV
jgi:glucokinase